MRLETGGRTGKPNYGAHPQVDIRTLHYLENEKTKIAQTRYQDVQNKTIFSQDARQKKAYQKQYEDKEELVGSDALQQGEALGTGWTFYRPHIPHIRQTDDK